MGMITEQLLVLVAGLGQGQNRTSVGLSFLAMRGKWPVWDERDNELGLRDTVAKIVASVVSGVDPDDVIPTVDDYVLADDFRVRIEKYIAGED